jgi:hypothetical protein
MYHARLCARQVPPAVDAAANTLPLATEPVPYVDCGERTVTAMAVTTV